ncbi:hypothetical protein FDG2_3249 [Candidatus Protofrankia californiensis]|uniref:Uncharacterized protein n=1 Tax=Candidatus Protofrankia californiensis TaxID=1839754 RepID=A0A1C3NZ81_9ACTN|nr:hypothetical protein FDG2_3249 [Candidatus Protofrankia californiensis]
MADRTGKDTLDWDTSQVRTHTGLCRHTALSTLAQLRAAALRAAATGALTLPATSPDSRPKPRPPRGSALTDEQVRALLNTIPTGDAPVPARAGLPCPPDLAPIRLSIPETLRLASLARHLTTGRITATEATFTLLWSLRRRRHQTVARWHHHSVRLTLITGPS